MIKRRVAIVGGGVSGLATAFYLRETHSRKELEIALFEQDERLGGRILSGEFGRSVFERGAEAIALRGPEVTELLRSLELEELRPERLPFGLKRKDQIIPVDMQVLRSYPNNLPAVWRSKLLSPIDKLIATIRSYFFRGPSGAGVSLSEYIERRWGKGAARKLFIPIYSGIYGASAEELSAALLNRTRSGGVPIASIRGGMSRLIERLASRSGADVRLGSKVERLEPGTGRRWRVNGQEFDGVILAGPADLSIALLRDVAPTASSLLSSTRSREAVSVVFGYSKLEVPKLTGYLVSNTSPVKGVTFVSQKWGLEHRGVIRVFLRPTDPRSISDEDLISLARSEIAPFVPEGAEEQLVVIDRWKSGVPALEKRARDTSRQIAAIVPSGLFISSAGHSGSGIYDCISSAREAASSISEFLRRTEKGGGEKRSGVSSELIVHARAEND